MTYFKDIVFCTSRNCLHFNKCSEALNSETIKEANEWASRVRLVVPPIKKIDKSKHCQYFTQKGKNNE